MHGPVTAPSTRAPAASVALSAFALLAGVTAMAACRARSSAAELGPPDADVALAGLERDRPIAIELDTDHGRIPCSIDARRTPSAAALFVGLATGRAPWRHPATGALETRPLYLDLDFHRAIPGVMIQSGCPLGDSTGHPGYRIPVEPRPDDGDRLRRPGALVLARYQAPPNRPDPAPPPPGHVIGSQFAVTLTAMPHLAGQVTVLGSCEGLEQARAISQALKPGQARPRLVRVRVTGVGN